MTKLGPHRTFRWLLATACLLSGCFSTAVSLSSDTIDERKRLQALATQPLGLSVDPGPHATDVVGFQYVLLGVPVARVYTTEIARDLQEALLLEGAIRGYMLTPLTSAQAASPRLSVTVEGLTLSGYDLLFTRRPSATIGLHATLIHPSKGHKSCRASAEATHTSRFAFSPDLTHALRSAIELATTELFNCIDGQKLDRHPLNANGDTAGK